MLAKNERCLKNFKHLLISKESEMIRGAIRTGSSSRGVDSIGTYEGCAVSSNDIVPAEVFLSYHFHDDLKSGQINPSFCLLFSAYAEALQAHASLKRKRSSKPAWQVGGQSRTEQASDARSVSSAASRQAKWTGSFFCTSSIQIPLSSRCRVFSGGLTIRMAEISL